MKIISSFVFALLMIGFVSAGAFCIDNENPLKVTGITSNIIGENISFTWDETQDLPACSYIASYRIYDASGLIGEVETNSFSMKKIANVYDMKVVAVDAVGNFGETGAYYVDYTPSSTTSSSGGSSSYPIWECSNWSLCVNNSQTRECFGKYDKEVQKVEIQDCFPAFEPLSDEGNALEEALLKEQKNNDKISEEEIQRSGIRGITGRAIQGVGDFATTTTGITSIGALLIFGFGIFFLVKRRKNRK